MTFVENIRRYHAMLLHLTHEDTREETMALRKEPGVIYSPVF